MRLCTVCTACKNSEGLPPAVFFVLNDERRYALRCPSGHITSTVIDEQRFEILFDIGAIAINDFYYREAVTSFSSSIERFYEFWTRTVLRSNGVPSDEVGRWWKTLGNQSERQLGSFITLYTSEFKRPPGLLPEKQQNFRNSVIHKGRIPTREEAVSFGKATLDVLRPKISELRQHCLDAVEKERLEFDGNPPEGWVEKGANRLYLETLLSLMNAPEPENSFEDELAKASENWRSMRDGLLKPGYFLFFEQSIDETRQAIRDGQMRPNIIRVPSEPTSSKS